MCGDDVLSIKVSKYRCVRVRVRLREAMRYRRRIQGVCMYVMYAYMYILRMYVRLLETETCRQRETQKTCRCGSTKARDGRDGKGNSQLGETKGGRGLADGWTAHGR